MGLGSSKKHARAFKTDPLQYYETSDESWVFGSEHIAAIKASLELLRLNFTANIILEYLRNVNTSNSVKWCHPNYTTYIHTKRTPLNNNTTPLSSDWLDAVCRTSGSSKSVKVVMLGAGGVGKSSITIRFVTDNFLEEYDPTIEDSYRKHLTINVPADQYDKSGCKYPCNNPQNVLFDILDTAGREEFSSLQDEWIREGQIFLLIFSVVYVETFDEIKLLRERILRCRDTDDYGEECDYAMVAVGNKCDLRVDGDVSRYGYGGRSGRDVNMDVVNDWCNETGIPYIETCAKTGKNIHFLFRQAIYEFYEKSKHLGNVYATKTS